MPYLKRVIEEDPFGKEMGLVRGLESDVVQFIRTRVVQEASAKYCGPEELYPWEAEQMSIPDNATGVCREDKELKKVIKYNECVSDLRAKRFSANFPEELCGALYLEEES